MTARLFSFRFASAYTFISGIFLALSLNVASTTLLSEIRIGRATAYWIAFFLFVASVLAFCINIVVENVRSIWERGGAPDDPDTIRALLRKRRVALYGLSAGALAAVMAAFTYARDGLR